MALLQARNPFDQYFDTDGSPLDYGKIYIGTAGVNPITSPIPVFYDIDGTIPASQPLLTRNGYVYRSGSPARIYVNSSDYSILVTNKAGGLIFSALNATSYGDAADISIIGPDGNPTSLESLFKTGVPVTVNTIADLRKVPSQYNNRIFVLGYYARGDAGGGMYFVDQSDFSSADNGGSIIVADDGARWKLSFTNMVNAHQFGAKDDGSDATSFINNAISALPAGGTLSGLGHSFTVTSLLLKSNMVMQDFNLTTKAGNADFVAPITIDGTTGGAKTNIVCQRIHVDGNRSNQTNIVAAAEDGGRHCWRLIGAMSDITIIDCSGNNSACDGIEIYSSTSAGSTDATFVFSNIHLIRFKGNNNRRHGFVIDSVTGLRIEDCQFNQNGRDLNTLDPYTTGSRGARFPTNISGTLYGQGMDIEGYGLGSCVNNVRITGTEALGNNRMGCLFLDAVDQNAAGFSPRQAIFIDNCYFDAGIGVGQPNYDGAALEFTSTIANASKPALYRDIIASNNRLGGKILCRSVSNAIFDGGQITWSGDTQIATLDYANNITIAAQVTGSASVINDSNSTFNLGPETLKYPPNPTMTFLSGPAGSLTGVTVTPVQNLRTRFFDFLITGTWTGAAGTPVFQFGLTGGATIVTPPQIDVYPAATGIAIPCAYGLTLNNFRFQDPGTGAVQIQVLLRVKV